MIKITGEAEYRGFIGEKGLTRVEGVWEGNRGI